MKVIVGSRLFLTEEPKHDETTPLAEEVGDNEYAVELPPGSIVTSVKFIAPYVVVQWWRRWE